VLQALPRIARADTEGGALAESLMAALTLTDDEANARLDAFLKKQSPKVTHSANGGEQ
jgi:hypothetical protein